MTIFLWAILYTPLSIPQALVCIAVVWAGLMIRRIQRRGGLSILWPALLVTIPWLALYAVLAVPLLIYHDGLPTGDSQKAILWADMILATNDPPDYSIAPATLNRDPVDFYTPGLHALTAALVSVGQPYGLTAVALFAIAISCAVALVASSLALELSQSRLWSHAALASFFVLTNIRFLRYIREPGYHLQNVVGEFFLFGLLWIGLSLIRRWNRRDFILALVLVGSLLLTHQFTTFIAAFALFPVAIFFLLSHRNRLLLILLLVTLVLGIIVATATGKIPHLFTLTPHLLDTTPALSDYVPLLGAVLIAAGIAGWIRIIRQPTVEVTAKYQQLAFVASSVVLLLLSQAPRFGIDIPPVRALFYSVVPLSIGAAFTIRYLAQIFGKQPVALGLIGLLLAFPTTTALASAFTLSHTIRTNSTITPGHLQLIERLSGAGLPSEAILIDDYNRRAASWLVLSGHSMFTRIGSDLRTQMRESQQSALRRELYLNQLDFEKIFSLGSRPESAALLAKHHITWVTGIERSSKAGFARNPALQAVAAGDDITVFSPRVAPAPPPSDIQTWLLRSSTLVNDIGDDEDTFEYLPASIAVSRLSDPQFDGRATYRLTTASVIPLRFNMQDFVDVLWRPEGADKPSVALELLLEVTVMPADLGIITPQGIQPLTTRQQVVRLTPDQLTIDGRGFITIMLSNPTEQPLGLDLIALGLARTP
jgi:hypothetical protein